MDAVEASRVPRAAARDRGTRVATAHDDMNWRVLAWSSSAIGLLACATHEYVYQPAVNTTAAVAGRPAANYPIPPESPRGDMRLATFGIADISAEDTPDESKVRAIHLREIISNNSTEAWIVDTREQHAALAGNGESRAAFATADAGPPPPAVVIPPGAKRTIDLFFPVPRALESESHLPAFDVIWNVRTDTRIVTERTPFERLEIYPTYSTYDYAYTYGWGPPYWYDPLYPRTRFVGVVALPPVYANRPVVVRPPPVVVHPSRPR